MGNAFTALVQNFANSDAIITVTNSLTGLIKVLDQITSFSGPLGTLGAISGLLMNKAGIGERTSSKKYMCSREHIYYSGDLYCAHPLKVA